MYEVIELLKDLIRSHWDNQGETINLLQWAEVGIREYGFYKVDEEIFDKLDFAKRIKKTLEKLEVEHDV